MDWLNSNYENFLLIWDFNSEDHEIEISSFLNNHEAKNIVKDKTCFNSKVFWIPCGLSDHCNLVITVLKNTYRNQKSNIRYYIDWENFDIAVFWTELREKE